MTEENAEHVEPISELDQKIKDAIADTEEESAPHLEQAPEAEKLKEPAEEPEPEPKGTGFQKRINKVTADKWEATRRAEAAEAKLAEMQQASTEKQNAEPTLKDFDYDEQAYNSALIEHKVDLRIKASASTSKEEERKRDNERLLKDFDKKAVKYAELKPDFADVISKVPTLQPAVLQAVMSEQNGPELAYFLGNHLDIADSIANMNPVAAAVEVGKLSMKLAEPIKIKPSSAPEPISGLSTSGGHVSSSMDDEMSIDDWMKTYNK